MLRPIPVQLHDCNSKSECRDAEAEGVELNVHDDETSRFLLIRCISPASELYCSNLSTFLWNCDGCSGDCSGAGLVFVMISNLYLRALQRLGGQLILNLWWYSSSDKRSM